jgi:hypothetical protein
MGDIAELSYVDLRLEDVMQIEVVKTVAARPSKVFETVADAAHWPVVFGTVTAVEMLTRGPLRVGARIRETHLMFGQQSTEELQVVEIERPRRLRLTARSHGLNYERDHIIDALNVGSRLMLILRIPPASQTQTGRALTSFITPFMEINLRDELERDLSDLAAAVTQSAA